MRLIATKNVAFVEYGDEYQSTVAMSGNKSDYSIIRKTVTWIRVFFKNFICKEMINTKKNSCGLVHFNFFCTYIFELCCLFVTFIFGLVFEFLFMNFTQN